LVPLVMSCQLPLAPVVPTVQSLLSRPVHFGLSPATSSATAPAGFTSVALWRTLRPAIVPFANAPNPAPPIVPP
jgi:hypothetical protein